MRITPAEAALIGTSIGATATFCAAWLTQRVTTKRDHERRIWDRRVDTYAELMRTVHTFARMRAEAQLTAELPQSEERKAEAHNAAVTLVARIELYSSEPLRLACERSFEGIDKWQEAWEDWHNQGADIRLASRADKLWRKFAERVKGSQEADRDLLDLLLEDVHGRQEEPEQRSGRRLLGVQLTLTTANSSASWETFLRKRQPTETDQD
ncbi:hypothetical protein [Streptomyces hokutonensis]|uniref:Secreted protein n=1 Tax=Streptomyces hokutonensis TaxID=1306990 RepID=A0ABW6MGX4_9ACTN